jgi:hypothetical protein
MLQVLTVCVDWVGNPVGSAHQAGPARVMISDDLCCYSYTSSMSTIKTGGVKIGSYNNVPWLDSLSGCFGKNWINSTPRYCMPV